MNWAAIVWFVLMVVFILIEANTVSLVSVWFAAGSLIAMVAALLGAPLWLQGVLFLAASVLLLLIFRPLVKKHFTPKLVRTNIDSIIGATGLVSADIDNILATGTVKLGATEWTARSTGGQKIGAGTLVTVDKIEGVKVFVSPAEVKETV